MKNYSPFLKDDISELVASDLKVLKSVHEGWYVEYKSELSNPKTIAKSVSSFANTYGGWVFYGVMENGKSDNTAESCPGIPKDDLDATMQRIRQSVASNLNPIPHFDTKVIEGPEPEMGLEEDRCVICIHVPFSTIAPHVHANGCIFRRVSDSSEPKPETDRHQLDMLFSRRDKIDKEYARWINRAPERSEEETHRPYLRLLLDADQYGLQGKEWNLNTSDVISEMNDRDKGIRLPIDSCYTSSHGIVARQTDKLNNISDFGVTWILGKNLRCEVWVPLTVIDNIDGARSSGYFDRYLHSDVFFKIVEAGNAKFGKAIDLNQLWHILSSILNAYLDLLEKNETPITFVLCKVMIHEIWRTMPFVDSEVLLGRMSDQGVPICLSNNALVPGGDHADSFYEIAITEPSGGIPKYAFPTLTAMELVYRAFGIQAFFSSIHSEDETRELLLELLNAGIRAATEIPK